MKSINFFFVLYISFFVSCRWPDKCMACGGFGYSRSIEESNKRKTFVRSYRNFEVLTDSLSYLSLKKEIFLEKRFRYGSHNARETEISVDSLGNAFQAGFSPIQGPNLNTNHRISIDKYFSKIPDTIRCNIYSGKKQRLIGKAIVY